MPMVELLFSLFMVYFVVGRSVGRSIDSPCLCDSKITMVVSTSHVWYQVESISISEQINFLWKLFISSLVVTCMILTICQYVYASMF